MRKQRNTAVIGGMRDKEEKLPERSSRKQVGRENDDCKRKLNEKVGKKGNSVLGYRGKNCNWLGKDQIMKGKRTKRRDKGNKEN